MSNRPIIAVVNDDTAFLHLMNELLQDEGYETIIHVVSSTALKMIQEEMPDLVVLDIRMHNPEAGWHILDMMRLDPKTKNIPVIVCSADSAQLRQKADRLRQHHAVALEKPFDLEELLAKVRTFI